MTQLYASVEGSEGGLGRMMLPWARCEIFHQKWNAPMLAPTCSRGWLTRVTQLGIGKWGWPTSFNRLNYVTGLSRLRVLLSARKVAEKDFVPGADDAHGGGRKTLVVFSGIEGMF